MGVQLSPLFPPCLTHESTKKENLMNQPNNTFPYVVTALYKFVALPDCEQIQKPLKQFCLDHNIKGTLLIANEGINGTVAGTAQAIAKLHDFFKNDALFAGRLSDLETKESWAEHPPFQRMKVRLKKEIVTLGDDTVDPTQQVGEYVSAQDWNTLIKDPEVINIDTRNDYEVAIGTFAGALNPNTQSFREFKDYVKQNLDPKKHKKVAMFCTGGIRCEKASSYMLKQGFEQVYHLKGGILKYLEVVDKSDSYWQGDCFVFDDRVSVTHGLELGEHTECHACRMPIKCEDMKRTEFELGVSCHHCFDKTDDVYKNRMRDRQKQIETAKSRGQKYFTEDAYREGKQRKRQAWQQQRERSMAGTTGEL